MVYGTKSFYRKHPGLYRLGTIFLLLAFLASAAPVSFAQITNQQPNTQDLAATCADDISADATNPAGNLHKIPLANLDALVPDAQLNPAALSSGFIVSCCAPDIPHRLSMHFLYTQLTSSAL